MDDYFAILGLAPGRHDPREIRRRFDRERTRLLSRMGQPAAGVQARRELDDLHMACATLSDPASQARYLAEHGNVDGTTRMRRFIEASLEGGLVRYSRRQRILAEGRRLGFSEFQTQLMIAQVQFGDTAIDSRPAGRAAPPRQGPWARVTAIGLLATALFMLMVEWASGI
jgi:hypothetical protein